MARGYAFRSHESEMDGMEAVIAGQILAGLVAIGLLRRRPRPVPVLVPARVRRPAPRERWGNN